MSLASGLIILSFILLWLGSAALAGAWRPQAEGAARRLGALAVLFTILCAGLGYWWQVSLDVQRRVEAASSTMVPVQPQLPCPDLKASLPAIERAGGGRLTINERGELLVAGAIWARLPAEQRAALSSLAASARRCVGGAEAGDPVFVRDIENGAVLAQIR